jgi:hypothetical protein
MNSVEERKHCAAKKQKKDSLTRATPNEKAVFFKIQLSYSNFQCKLLLSIMNRDHVPIYSPVYIR